MAQMQTLAASTDAVQRLVLAEIAEGVALLDARDPVFALLDINPAGRTFLAHHPPALVGQPWASAFDPADAPALLAILRRVVATGESYTAHAYPCRRAAGRGAVYRDWKCVPVRDDAGAVERLMVIFTDATEQPQRRSGRAAQLEAIIGGMLDGVVILDLCGRVLETNEAGRALLNLTPDLHEPLLDEALAALCPRYADGRIFEAGDLVTAVLAGQTIADEEFVLGEPDGSADTNKRAVSLSAAPVRDTQGQARGAVILLRDITAQKRADREKDAILSLIAHEVKSPLTAIKGFAQLATRAAQRGATGERITRHLQVVDQQSERLGRLVGELSDVGRIQQGRLQQELVDFDLALLTHTLVEQQRVTLTSHRLRLTIADAPLIVHADPHRIEQVITNLLTNAVKYSPEASDVTITLARQGDTAHLAVRDAGAGIPRTELPRLFGRFYRAADTAAGHPGGLGLGLFIAREIVTGSGGRLWAESEEGQGSTFHVVLPLTGASLDSGQRRH
ncbi:MAG: PAS domain-containing sensor histidine kinase [Thermomicrobiales bacterium]